MLKIKDNVDLKSLAKLGITDNTMRFVSLGNNKMQWQPYKTETTIQSGVFDMLEIDKETRIITNNGDNDTLYDLIKADIVEKVSDENE